MKARILKSEVMAVPEGFEDVGGSDFYHATFNQDDLTPSFDGNDLVMTKSVEETYPVQVNDKDGNKVTVYKKTGHTLEYKCRYALEDKVVKQDFNVAGHDHQ